MGTLAFMRVVESGPPSVVLPQPVTMPWVGSGEVREVWSLGDNLLPVGIASLLWNTGRTQDPLLTLDL